MYKNYVRQLKVKYRNYSGRRKGSQVAGIPSFLSITHILRRLQEFRDFYVCCTLKIQDANLDAFLNTFDKMLHDYPLLISSFRLQCYMHTSSLEEEKLQPKQENCTLEG